MTPFNLQIFASILEAVFENLITVNYGRAVAEALVAAFPQRRSGFPSGQHLGFVVDRAALGQVFSEYFGYP
jgi:hypothetical protein